MSAPSISFGLCSRAGRKEQNQDFCDLLIPKDALLQTKGIALALADGISSSKVSQEAAEVAVGGFLRDYYATPEGWSVERAARRVVEATSGWLYGRTRQSSHRFEIEKGYVCTLSALILKGSSITIVHVGDSRIYRLTQTALTQLSSDHRIWLNSRESYLSRAMGMDSTLQPQIEAHGAEVGEYYLIMSDGVYEVLDETTLREVIDTQESLQEVAEALVALAYERGSEDNLSVLIMRVESLALDSDLLSQERQKPIAPLLEPQSFFEGFRIERVLHRSQRSHVYLASEGAQRLIIKAPTVEAKNDTPFLERLVMEEWIAARTQSPHLLRAYASSRPRNYLYGLYAYVEGVTLAQWMRDNPLRTLDQVRDIAAQLAKALQALHRQGIIHQDLRPENILIDAHGTVTLIDLGSALIEGISYVGEPEAMPGTPLYLAPEYFVEGPISPRGDIYSLGVLVYELLGSAHPYGVELARCKSLLSQKRLHYRSLFVPHKIPLWVDGALKKALSVDPLERYAELSEFVFDLSHPNRDFLKSSLPPLIERNPLIFWQSLSFVLTLALIALLIKP